MHSFLKDCEKKIEKEKDENNDFIQQMTYQHYINLPCFYPEYNPDGGINTPMGIFRLEGHDPLEEGYGIVYKFDSIKEISPLELHKFTYTVNISDLNINFFDKVNKISLYKDKYMYLPSIKIDKSKTLIDVFSGTYRLEGLDPEIHGYGIIYKFPFNGTIHNDDVNKYKHICEIK